MVKITFTKEEKEKYLTNEKNSEGEIYDENEEIINDVILLGWVIRKNNIINITENEINNTESTIDNIENIDDNEEKVEKKKRKRNNNEENREVKKRKQDKRRKRDKKIEKLIKEMDTPENENEKEIVEETGEEVNYIAELVKQYYKVEKRNRRSIWEWYHLGQKFEQKVEELKNKEENEEKNNDEIKEELYDGMMKHLIEEKRGTVRKRMQKASRVYEMFMKIGNEKINRIKEICVSVVTTLTDTEIEKIVTHFKKI